MSNNDQKSCEEAQDIQSLCSEAESNAEALVGPLQRTVEELDRLYDNIKTDPEKGRSAQELCDEIDGVILNIKEMVAASMLEIEKAVANAQNVDCKDIEKDTCK